MPVLAAALLAGCASTGAAPSTGPPSTSVTTAGSAPRGTGMPGSTVTDSAPPGSTPPDVDPTWTATTLAPEPLALAPAPCPAGVGAHDRVEAPGPPPSTPPALVAPLDQLRRTAGTVSVAITDVGAPFGSGSSTGPRAGSARTPLVALDAERRTVPASNQKLLIAAAVLEAEGPDATFTTRVVATGPVVDGTVRGDLVLVGGGDPTLTSGALPLGSDPTAGQVPIPGDALATLARQVRGGGITAVEGQIVVDDRRFDQQRYGAAGAAATVGPLSALIVDRNRSFDTPTFATDPAPAHGARFAAALQQTGIRATPGAASVAPDAGPTTGAVVASVQSPPLRAIVAQLLRSSDNLYAEVLTKDLGFRAGGPGRGSTADGLTAARRILAGLCVTLDGVDADGSGLSVANRRTAGGIERLLEVAMTRPWWPDFRDALAVAGRSGTLAGRMTAGAATGLVRAKSGSVGHARALSGYVPIAGHTIVFSILVDDATADAENAIDTFVTTLAATP